MKFDNLKVAGQYKNLQIPLPKPLLQFANVKGT